MEEKPEKKLISKFDDPESARLCKAEGRHENWQRWGDFI